MTGSYDPRREAGGVARELERLRAQADVSWPEEVRLLRFLGLQDGMRILDLGCGPGFTTAALAAALPAAQITAVDHDSELLKLAMGALRPEGEQPIERGAVERRPVHLVQADAYHLPAVDDSFDFAVARYVFQHLDDPEASAQELFRVLGPGARLAVIDVDAALWGVAEPVFPEVAPVYAKTGRAQAERGGNRLIGRRLHRILRAAGFVDVHTDAFVYHSDDHGLDAFAPQLTPDRLEPLRARRIISDADLAVVRRAYERFRQAPDAFVMMLGLIGSGRKPQ